MTIVDTRVEHSIEERAKMIAAAEVAIRDLIAKDPARAWQVLMLQDEADPNGEWTTSIKSLAFWQLVESGELEIGDDLTVRVPSAHA